MRDSLNSGLPSDRFEVDWWVNTQRVNRRLSRRARLRLDLAHFLAAGAIIVNPTRIDTQGFPYPIEDPTKKSFSDEYGGEASLLLVEIPDDFQTLRAIDNELALSWRENTRILFENLFDQGYLVTDFVYLSGNHPRSYYVLSHGESTF
jgi:predicted GNAT superfamily acetyltransferase